jgi:uncharacterized protein YgiM (DUF1202 family)
MMKRLVALSLALILIISCAAASAAGWYRLTDKKRIFNLPGYDSKAIDSYRADWALYINKSVDSTWASVTFSNGVTGYIEKKYLSRDKSFTAWVSKDTGLKHGPGSGFQNEGSLSKGAKVTVLTNGSNYSFVSSDAGYGYVANSVLSRKKVSGSGATSGGKSVNYTAWVVTRGDPIGLRGEPSGSDSAVFETYYNGTAVTVLTELGEFSYVRMANGHEGYMRSKYLSRNKPAQISAQAAAASIPTGDAPVAPADVQQSSGFPFSATAVKDSEGNSPRLYRGEGLGWSSDVIAVGATVTVLDAGNDPYWWKVQVNGVSGYMPGKFFIR